MIDPSDLRDGEPFATFDAGRAAGGSLIVNGHGRRFVNEAAPYSDFAKAFATFDVSTSTFPNETAWMIVDHALRSKVQILSMRPDGPTPPWVPTADTIEVLAARIGVDPTVLRSTLDTFNADARDGRDPEFGRPRGMLGASIRPLSGPFYAVRILPGTLGTNGGPRLDQHSRVRHVRGGIVPGLYAAGNAAASPLGWAYPGAGATLFVGMTQGFLAGEHLATRPDSSTEETR